MKIAKMHLENFRGIKSLNLELMGKDAAIYGANGTGKTTIANAIIWALLDVPATGEKDFNPKSTGTHDLQHSVELTVTADDGAVYTLYKVFFEVWTKKKGSATKEFSGHRTEYKINGIPYKKGAYNKAVERICGTDMENIKKLMLEGYFLEALSVDERRHTLFDICGDVSDDDVMQSSELADLPSFLAVPGTEDQAYTPEEYLKIAKAQRMQMNKDLQILPARIDEAEKGIPENLPEKSVLESTREQFLKDHKALALKINALTSGSGKEQAILAAKSEYNKAVQKYDEKMHQKNTAIYQQLEEMAAQKSKLSQAKGECFNHLKELKKEYSELNAMRDKLLEQYAQIDAHQWNPEQETCPTCHRELPREEIDKLKAEFNSIKSHKKEKINEQGQQCSITKIKALEPLIRKADEEYKSICSKDDKLSADIMALQKTIQSIPFEDTDEGKALENKILEAEKLEDVYTTGAYKELQDQCNELNDAIRGADITLANISSAEKSRQRVTELRKLQLDTAVALEQVEYGIHLVEEFSRKKAAMVTDKINAKFKHVRFVLFENQINGGLKEICEPTIQNASRQWVPYKSANTAARVNAELEIIDVLNQYYHTNLPIIMDRAESVSHPIDIAQQLIRLIVSADDIDLRIELKED